MAEYVIGGQRFPESDTGPRTRIDPFGKSLQKASLTSDLCPESVMFSPECRDVLFFIGGELSRKHPVIGILSYRGGGPDQKESYYHFGGSSVPTRRVRLPYPWIPHTLGDHPPTPGTSYRTLWGWVPPTGPCGGGVPPTLGTSPTWVPPPSYHPGYTHLPRGSAVLHHGYTQCSGSCRMGPGKRVPGGRGREVVG